MKNIIDVSKWNGSINWAKTKPYIDGAILRIGFRGYGDGTIVVDERFFEYYDECKKNNIPFGVYFFTQRKNYSEGRREAAWVVNQLNKLDYKPLFPVYCDSEWRNNAHTGRADHIGVNERTRSIIGFCETMEQNGYFAGVYRSTDWFRSKLNDGLITRFSHWVADYRINAEGRHYCGYTGSFAMWQYSSKRKIDGIRGNVDVNECYLNFPEIIKNNGLNGYPKPETETVPVSDPVEPVPDPVEIVVPDIPSTDEPREPDPETETLFKAILNAIIKFIMHIITKNER